MTLRRPLPRDRYGRPLPPGSPDGLTARSVVERATGPIEERLALALGLFERRCFFEAHEILESIWKSGDADPDDLAFWKGLTQLAVGLCHLQRGNPAGAAALLERAARHLAARPAPHRGVDVPAVIRCALELAARIRRDGLPPRIEFPPLITAGRA